MFRLVFLAFHGERRAPAGGTAHAAHGAGAHLHDAPPAMAFALVVLAIGSVVAGYASLSGRFETFLEPSFALPSAELPVANVDLELTLMGVSTAVAILGIGLAVFFFLKRRSAADRVAEQCAGLHRVLEHKYYVDELYDAAIVQPIRLASEHVLWQGVDVRLIDGSVNGVGAMVRGGGQGLRRLQTGSVRAYAASLFLGVVMILGYFLWR
jgi:NADH-quinone oxidoreductase subunit L